MPGAKLASESKAQDSTNLDRSQPIVQRSLCPVANQPRTKEFGYVAGHRYASVNAGEPYTSHPLTLPAGIAGPPVGFHLTDENNTDPKVAIRG